jgi:hypothetical protein
MARAAAYEAAGRCKLFERRERNAERCRDLGTVGPARADGLYARVARSVGSIWNRSK